jgi:hypothetical protein
MFLHTCVTAPKLKKPLAILLAILPAILPETFGTLVTLVTGVAVPMMEDVTVGIMVAIIIVGVMTADMVVATITVGIAEDAGIPVPNNVVVQLWNVMNVSRDNFSAIPKLEKMLVRAWASTLTATMISQWM